MAVSPPHRPSASQQTDHNDQNKNLIKDFRQLKSEYEQTKEIQHDLILNYHETILKVITSLQQSNEEHQQNIEQLKTDINNQIQDNETLKVNFFFFLK